MVYQPANAFTSWMDLEDIEVTYEFPQGSVSVDSTVRPVGSLGSSCCLGTLPALDEVVDNSRELSTELARERFDGAMDTAISCHQPSTCEEF